jgi:DNA topoisomerase-2
LGFIYLFVEKLKVLVQKFATKQQGSIEKTNAEAGGDTYTAAGVIEAVGSTRLRITELPIRCWTMDHKEFLEYLVSDVKKGR